MYKLLVIYALCMHSATIDYIPKRAMCFPIGTPTLHPKIQDIVSFLLPLIQLHKHKHATNRVLPPFFLGVCGIQGCGKTTLTRELQGLLTRPPYNLRVLGFSLDDLCLPRCELRALADKHAQNPFLMQRGLPGTHDMHLAGSFFDHLSRQGSDVDAIVRVPTYDKSANAGEGDRVDEGLWREEKSPWDIIVFEGWMVGFTPLGRVEVERRWLENKKTRNGTLGRHKLQDLLWLDEQLQKYQDLWGKVEALIHLWVSFPCFSFFTMDVRTGRLMG